MIDIEKSCCFTGYRPDKFSFQFETDCTEHKIFTKRLNTAISKAILSGCTNFYTGMAQGFDIVAAEQVALIKSINKKVKLTAVVPFKEQASSWNEQWKRRYYALLDECDDVVIIHEKYEKWVFNERNRYMVDRCRYVLTYFDGKKGGTESTLKYAIKHGRVVTNIFNDDIIGNDIKSYKAYFGLVSPESK